MPRRHIFRVAYSGTLPEGTDGHCTVDADDSVSVYPFSLKALFGFMFCCLEGQKLGAGVWCSGWNTRPKPQQHFYDENFWKKVEASR